MVRNYISLSDPEDEDSSGVESFDEDDIYDGSDNADEVIYQIPDSNAQAPYKIVCPSYSGSSRLITSHSPMMSYHLLQSPLMGMTSMMNWKVELMKVRTQEPSLP